MKEIYRALGNYFSRKADIKDGLVFNNTKPHPSGTISVDNYMPETPNASVSYNIRIYPAAGGNVIEVRSYGHQKSNHVYEDTGRLYIVPDDEDLMEGIREAMVVDKLSN